MRLGWRIPLPGPFSLSGTVWRSKRRRATPRYKVLDCGHAHRTEQAHRECLEAGVRHAAAETRATLHDLSDAELVALAEKYVATHPEGGASLDLLNAELDRRLNRGEQ